MMKYVRLVARVATLAFIAATTMQAQNNRGRGDSVFVWSARIGDGGTLTVKNIVGGITVTESSGDRVEVRAEKQMRGRGDPSDITFDVQQSSSGATICTVYRGESACDEGRFSNTRFSVRYTIAMPRGLRLRATTGNGELSVDRAGSEVELQHRKRRHSHRPNRWSRDARRRATAISRWRARADQCAHRRAMAAFSFRRRLVRCRRRRVTATSTCECGTLTNAGDMNFTSGSGAVRVTLPSDFNGDVDASTGNGDLRTDFAIQLIGRLDPQHMRGTIGSGGRTIHLQTGNGTLEIRKGS